MKETIKLKNPLIVNGEPLTELKHDADEITVELFAAAEGRKLRATSGAGAAFEYDYSFHKTLGFAAVIAANPNIAWEDLERVKGRDILELMKVGRNFIIGSGASEDESSDPPSETTPEPSTPE